MLKEAFLTFEFFMKILKISVRNLNRIIETTAKAVKEGKVLIFPTDTVYGLVANAQNEQAVKKIFKIKRRKFQKTLPIFVRNIKMAKEFAFINREQEKFLTPHQNKCGARQEKVWFTRLNFIEIEGILDKKRVKIWAGKGKVTAVLKAKPEAKKLFKFGIISSDNKIGMRIPKYKLINLLLKKLNFPVTGTSANISGNPASTKIKEVLRQFENRKEQPDLAIDAGNLPKSKPSKVLDLTNSPPKILRS